MYQNIMIENSLHLYQKNGQLYIQGEKEHHVPIEDINMLLLSNPQMTISAQSLLSLTQNGTAVVFCNNKRMPTAMILPFAANARRLKMIRLQIQQSKPRLKRLWQQIIQQKIRNQGRCLQLAGKNDTITILADKVTSGDSKNIEAVAAAIYFKTLFGKTFSRHEDNVLNGMLNYGYSIIRSAIARYLAMYGLEPCLGLFHHNEMNAFNLADDLIEPFRPLVDLYVIIHKYEASKELSLAVRQKLVQILNGSIRSHDEIHSVHYAIERTVQSLLRCFTGASDKLVLPQLMAWKTHTYE